MLSLGNAAITSEQLKAVKGIGPRKPGSSKDRATKRHDDLTGPRFWPPPWNQHIQHIIFDLWKKHSAFFWRGKPWTDFQHHCRDYQSGQATHADNEYIFVNPYQDNNPYSPHIQPIIQPATHHALRIWANWPMELEEREGRSWCHAVAGPSWNNELNHG